MGMDKHANKPALGMRLGVVAALALWAAAAGATQWKWMDASGHLQYSDRPPPADVPDKNILEHPSYSRQVQPADNAPASASGTAAASAPKGVDPELEARRRKEQEAKEAAQKDAEAQQAKAKADNCARARSYQQTLTSGVRIARTNDKGEREILDDKGRAQEEARAQQAIRDNCQ